ncbi:molybdopterin molybdotransferase MoeA [Aureisphaera galaxeae]|uniref:molybdopterin molybdotransferase MoeA n=1 Tax=Aureisphaera galaxeae TaxID=1538023 RepID=UPI00234FE6A3|nr:gephyrin-like molybdotransferase Glp [Aureisphaera galaxeae]MDC8002480.1 molybdopterin molybdotransferase MoeA [Aureisphaera galaxeae]
MVSIPEALQIIEDNVFPTTQSEMKRVSEALGYVLSEAVASPINMPPFRQSAMDGYALHLHDSNTYTLVGEVKAGDAHQLDLNSGDAIRIFTGAAVPDTANAVVMQEKVSARGETIQIEGTVALHANIRPQGEQVKEGSTALEKGTLLTPAGIGFLTSLGITEVNVHKKPTITIVTTGNELIAPGQPLEHGQIYESNATMLASSLQGLGYDKVTIRKVEDDYDKTFKLLQSSILESDLVLITGGISVGDYDFVGKALIEMGVNQLFYKVKQKPGKPLFFGKKEETVVFALPGNPAAALTCFNIYVRKALERMSGNLHFSITKTKEPLAAPFQRKGDRPQFLKAMYANGSVTILDGQSSAMLQTFALANALVFAPEEMVDMKPGDIVDVIHVPNS